MVARVERVARVKRVARVARVESVARVARVKRVESVARVKRVGEYKDEVQQQHKSIDTRIFIRNRL